jgi:uncharacterized protein YbaP (TraB family)
MRCGVLIGQTLAVWLGFAGLGHAQPALWTVRDADSTITLFGSIHVLPKGLDWESPELRQRLAAADDIWFEIPMDDASRGDGAVLGLQLGLVGPGQPTLSTMLSKKDFAHFRKLWEKFNGPPDLPDRCQPWFAESMLVVLAARKAGFDTEQGVEAVISSEAPTTARREAFETTSEQIRMLASAPVPEQLNSLRDTMRGLDQVSHELATLIDVWTRGDVKGLSRIGNEQIRRSDPQLYKRLILERNRRWVVKISQRLSGSGNSFVVVGAGHLGGPDGVPSLLKAAGYDVQGPGLKK